jgi:hypothetical protein
MVNQPVTPGVDEAAGEDPCDHPSVTGRHPERLFHQVERDRADQDAAAERHDQPDRAKADLEQDRDDRADHQRRRGQGPPAERLPHLDPQDLAAYPLDLARAPGPSRPPTVPTSYESGGLALVGEARDHLEF